MSVDKLSRIMAMDERDLYGEFTRLLPLRKQRKLLKTLYEWGNSRYFEAIASKIESRAEAKVQCCIDLHNGYVVRNVKAYIEALCAYLRGHAILTEVMREYRYELVDETSHDDPIDPKPLPAKLANFLRLCDEAVKRNMHYYDDEDANSYRWLAAYYHKYEQVATAMHDIKGGGEYYEIVLLSTHSTHPVIDAAINGAKLELIELNKDSHE